jgi:IS30 family transposase
LVRQYLKKRSCFINVDDKELEQITNQLNDRPRKSLNYATPNEIFDKHFDLAKETSV